ncbi:MAG: hypothetical protein DRJ68_02810 [Thermoprotei archaeon]|nr:MAG: hypothetical protein DRJ68_02810 [Thermoprotei archaeon]
MYAAARLRGQQIYNGLTPPAGGFNVSLEVTLIVEGLHDFERAKRLGSLNPEFSKEASTIYLSGEDASSIGVSDGDVVEVSSDSGSVKVVAKLLDGLNKGMALMPPSPWSMALMPPSGGSTSTVKVKVSKSTGETTSLATLIPL